MSTKFDYYYTHEAEQFTFYRIPKALFTEPLFQDLSVEAKVLYGLMLDRVGLSIRSGWVDEQDRVYIYFTVVDIQQQLGCSKTNGATLPWRTTTSDPSSRGSFLLVPTCFLPGRRLSVSANRTCPGSRWRTGC